MIRPKSMIRSAFVLGSALLLLAAAGCGNRGGSAPSDEVARTALDAALKTWRDGGKPGTVAGMDPPVQVLDTPWAQGDRLASYEILGEETGTAAEKQFTVRLVLAGKPERTQEVTYHVLGRGPVMVFRDEDYKRNINMEDGPKLEKPGSRTRRRG
jgi:hypothetical protein